MGLIFTGNKKSFEDAINKAIDRFDGRWSDEELKKYIGMALADKIIEYYGWQIEKIVTDEFIKEVMKDFDPAKVVKGYVEESFKEKAKQFFR